MLLLKYKPFWNAPSLHGYDWLPDHQFWFQGSTDILSSFHPNFLNDYELRVEPEALRAIEFVIYNSQAIDEKIAQRPSTLVHGDLRVENVLFGTCSKQRGVVIIDWGTPTPPWLRWILLISSVVVCQCLLVETGFVIFAQVGIRVWLRMV